MLLHEIKKYSMVTILSLLFSVCVHPLLADENSLGHSSEGLLEVETVHFATTSVKPWGIRTAGTIQGLLVSVVEALEQQTCIPIANELQPYPRVVHSLHSGHVDFAILFDSEFSKQAAIHIGHVVDTSMIVVAQAGSPQMRSLDELQGMKVGLIRGSKYGVAFDDATHFKRIQVSNMEQGLAMLLRDRVDVMVGTDQALFWAMQKMDVGAKRLSKVFVLAGATGSLYASKHSTRLDLIPVYQRALQTLRDNGTLERIFDAKYEWAPSEFID